MQPPPLILLSLHDKLAQPFWHIMVGRPPISQQTGCLATVLAESLSITSSEKPWASAVQASMRKYWTVIGFFASATPVGILLGVILSSVSNSDAAAAVSALASGMLLPRNGLPALIQHARLINA